MYMIDRRDVKYLEYATATAIKKEKTVYVSFLHL